MDEKLQKVIFDINSNIIKIEDSCCNDTIQFLPNSIK